MMMELDITSVNSDNGWDERNCTYLKQLCENIKCNVNGYREKAHLLKILSTSIKMSSLCLSAGTSIMSYNLNGMEDSSYILALNVVSTMSVLVATVENILGFDKDIRTLYVSINRLAYISQFIEIQFHTKIEDRINMNQLLNMVAHERDFVEIKINN